MKGSLYNVGEFMRGLVYLWSEVRMLDFSNYGWVVICFVKIRWKRSVKNWKICVVYNEDGEGCERGMS